MTPRITLQLYTLRTQLEADLENTLDEITRIGFMCVEPAGFHGQTVSKFSRLLKERALSAPTGHCELPVGDAKNQVIENALELGHRYLITGGPPGWQDSYGTADQIKAAAEQYCIAANNAAEHGLQVGYHNHDWDLAEIGGTPAYHIFLAHTPENVLWQADVFWIARAKIDPVGFLEEIGPRGKTLHFKDGHVHDLRIEPPYLPAGKGDLDLAACASAARYAEYIAVELDTYEGDTLEAVATSYRYLTSQGIAT
jgi:sugar phosphate isomerase/epimerase